MNEKMKNRIFRVFVLLLALIAVIMGIDMEIKLHRLSSAIPVAVYENADTTNVLASADNTAQTEAKTTVSETVSVSAVKTTSQTTSQTATVSVSAEIEQANASVSESAENADFVSSTAEESQPSTTAKEDTAETVTAADELNDEQVYYVTKSGKKYHIGSCSYLSKSKIEIAADEILSGGYEACSRCIK